MGGGGIFHAISLFVDSFYNVNNFPHVSHSIQQHDIINNKNFVPNQQHRNGNNFFDPTAIKADSAVVSSTSRKNLAPRSTGSSLTSGAAMRNADLDCFSLFFDPECLALGDPNSNLTFRCFMKCINNIFASLFWFHLFYSFPFFLFTFIRSFLSSSFFLLFLCLFLCLFVSFFLCMFVCFFCLFVCLFVSFFHSFFFHFSLFVSSFIFLLICSIIFSIYSFLTSFFPFIYSFPVFIFFRLFFLSILTLLFPHFFSFFFCLFHLFFLLFFLSLRSLPLLYIFSTIFCSRTIFLKFVLKVHVATLLIYYINGNFSERILSKRKID